MHYTSLKLGEKLRLDLPWTELQFESSSESLDVFMVFPLHRKACNATHLFMSPFLCFSTASPNRAKWVTTRLKQAGQSLESHLSFYSHTLNHSLPSETDVQIDVQLLDSYSQYYLLFCSTYCQAEIKLPETIAWQWIKQVGRLKYNISPIYLLLQMKTFLCYFNNRVYDQFCLQFLKYWVTCGNEGVLAWGWAYLFVYLCIPVVVRLSSEWDVSGHEPKSNNIKCCC